MNVQPMVPTAIAQSAGTSNYPAENVEEAGVHAAKHRIKPCWQGRQPAAPTCTMKGMACFTPSGSIHVTSEFFQAFSATISACGSARDKPLWAGGGVDLSGGVRSARAGWAGRRRRRRVGARLATPTAWPVAHFSFQCGRPGGGAGAPAHLQLAPRPVLHRWEGRAPEGGQIHL